MITSQVNLPKELLEDIKSTFRKSIYFALLFLKVDILLCFFLKVDIMENNKRKQMLYQKTDFNNHLICQLPSIMKCCKCKRNNSIVVEANSLFQSCLFCGTPNYVKKLK